MSNSYYQSHQKLPFIYQTGQQKINEAKVLVIGAGGLGCPCLQALVGCGIGFLTIADFDKIELSNLHRQQLFFVKDVGKFKAKTAAMHLRKLNPFIDINYHQIKIEQPNILKLLKPYQIIVDATDNFETRYLINDACVVLNKPLVYGAIHQTEGHFTVFNYKNSGTLRCLFPQNTTLNTLQTCAQIGAYNLITNLIGNYMAGEVIKIVLQNLEVNFNKLVCLDAISATATKFFYSHNEANRLKSNKFFSLLNTTNTLTPLQIITKAKSQTLCLIDVRTLAERNVFNIGGLHIVLDDFIKTKHLNFTSNNLYVFYCEKGVRSHKAVNFCNKMGYLNCYSLKNGLLSNKKWLKKLSLL